MIDEAPVSLLPLHDVPDRGRSSYCIVNNRQVHYLEWGAVDAEHVIALHGGGQTAYMYEDVAHHLAADGYHIVAPDLPSHGDSEGLALHEALSRKSFARHVAALLAELGIDRAHIIGASLGGLVGTSLAAQKLIEARSLALLDVAPMVNAGGVDRIAEFMARHDSFDTLADAAAAVGEYLSVRVGLAEPHRLSRNLRQRPDGRWVWKHATNGPAPVVELARDLPQGWASLFDGLEDEAATVACPVLLVRGAESDVLTPSGVHQALDVFPDLRVREAASAGHLVVGDNPGTIAEVIRSFLTTIRSTTSGEI